MLRRGTAVAALVCGAGLAIAVAGCSPGSDVENIADLDTVTTLFSPGADFKTPFRFTVVDSITQLGDMPVTITPPQHQAIIDRIRADMITAGWTEVANPSMSDQPDVAIQPGVTTSTSSGVAYWPPYWGWYPGYPAYCCWGWGGWATAYSYTTGTLVMAMLDLKHPDATSVPVMWLGAVNGVLGSSTASNQSRIANGIDQAFQQSPYLVK